MAHILKGEKVIDVHLFHSWVLLELDDGTSVRLENVKDLLPLINGASFELSKKKVHTYARLVHEFDEASIEDLLKEAALEGYITCQGCGLHLEVDCPFCGECGWENPVVM